MNVMSIKTVVSVIDHYTNLTQRVCLPQNGHAADEGASLLLIDRACGVRTEYLHYTYEIQIKTSYDVTLYDWLSLAFHHSCSWDLIFMELQTNYGRFLIFCFYAIPV